MLLLANNIFTCPLHSGGSTTEVVSVCLWCVCVCVCVWWVGWGDDQDLKYKDGNTGFFNSDKDEDYFFVIPLNSLRKKVKGTKLTLKVSNKDMAVDLCYQTS